MILYAYLLSKIKHTNKKTKVARIIEVFLYIFTLYDLCTFSFSICTILAKINWPPGHKLIENQRKCTITSCLNS